jgi:hypothetical protein
MNKNKNKQTRSTQSNTNWQHWADAPVPTEPQPSRRVKARRKFKPVKQITWCNGHEGPRMDKRFKQMPEGLERSFAILLDRRDSLEWTRDKDGNLVELIRNSEGHFTCTKCGNHVSESTVDQLVRRIQRYDISHDVMLSAWDTVDSIIERENAADLTRELSQ